jgi:signal transduction histidine kinase
MVLPLTGSDRVLGTLVVARVTGRREFTEDDLEMAASFASQAAVALELAQAREDAQRAAVLQDRDRIARDLHDHVIQQVFAAGLQLEGIGVTADPGTAERLDRVVERLDGAIAQIRTSIYSLRDHLGPQGLGVRAAVLDLVAELAPTLASTAGSDPQVRFSGPVDTVVDGDLAQDLVAVVRESLTNVARHAGTTTSVEVGLSATSALLEVRVADDGCGPGGGTRRSGLANLRSRAAARGGTCEVEELRPGAERPGTVVRWAVPLVRES